MFLDLTYHQHLFMLGVHSIAVATIIVTLNRSVVTANVIIRDEQLGLQMHSLVSTWTVNLLLIISCITEESKIPNEI